METMVATLSSEGGSGQAIVDPGPLDPGRTNGLAKSAAGNRTQLRVVRSLREGTVQVRTTSVFHCGSRT